MKKQIICNDAPSAIGPYSQAIEVNGMLFVSGQTPFIGDTGEIPEGVPAQTRQCFENIKAIITKAGGNMDNIIKCSVFLKDMNDFTEMNGVYAEYFKEPYPARTTIEAARLPKDVMVEIDAIAVL